MRSQLRLWWQKNKRPRSAIVIITVSVLLVVLIVVEVRLYGTGFAGKTLFDWLNILGVLAIPVVVGFGAAWFTGVQHQRDQRLSREQHDHEQVLAEQRAKSAREAAEKRAQTEREIASDNQHEAALQSYIDKISELLLKEHLRESQPQDEARIIARVRTLTTLPHLDKVRKDYYPILV